MAVHLSSPVLARAVSQASTAPAAPVGPSTRLPPPRARARREEDAAEAQRASLLATAATQRDIEDDPLELLQHEAQQQALPPVSQGQVLRLYERLKDEPEFAQLVQTFKDAFAQDGAPIDHATLAARLTALIGAHPQLMHRANAAVGAGGEPPPMDVRLVQSNVVGLALGALLAAHIEGNADKRASLKRIEMYNAILGGLNKYVTDVLMAAQKRITTTLNRRKGRQLSHTMVVVDGVADALSCDFAPYDEQAKRYVPAFAYSDQHGGSRQMGQTEISYAIEQATQWRQTVTNNLQKQTNFFQGIDSTQTSHMNIITSVMKGTKDSIDVVTRNLAN